jgi:hypothetical protein
VKISDISAMNMTFLANEICEPDAISQILTNAGLRAFWRDLWFERADREIVMCF